MSFQFGGGSNYNKSAGSGQEDYFIGPLADFNPIKKTGPDDISLFDIVTEDDLNDMGNKLSADDLLGFGIEVSDFDDTEWLGLTGKGLFGEEQPTPQMINNIFSAPPKKKDENGNKVFNAHRENNKNPYGTDWSWNTLV